MFCQCLLVPTDDDSSESRYIELYLDENTKVGSIVSRLIGGKVLEKGTDITDYVFKQTEAPIDITEMEDVALLYRKGALKGLTEIDADKLVRDYYGSQTLSQKIGMIIERRLICNCYLSTVVSYTDDFEQRRRTPINQRLYWRTRAFPVSCSLTF